MIRTRDHLSGILGLDNGGIATLGSLTISNITAAADGNGNGTDESLEDFKKTIIYELLLAHDQGSRSFHIGLGSVALALAAIMIMRIIYDAWRCSQLQVQLRPSKFTQFKWLKAIHTAEAFPLILFTGLIVQQLVFVPVQSTALNSVTVLGCTRTTQIVYPAIFIVVYLHVVFGLEMTFRSFSRTTFHPRRKWTTAICLAIVALMLLLTWLPTTIFKTRERCVGSLVWWPIRYNIMSIVILGTAFVSFKIMALIIGLRLRRTVNVDPNERIAASRMVFYLNGASVLNAFIIPFFIQAQMHKFDSKLTSSRLAELVFFGQGVLLGALHMVMRANAGRLVIKPSNTPWQKRRRFRLFGPSDLEILNISGPVGLLPRDNDSVENLPRHPEKAQFGSNDEPPAWSPSRGSPPPFPTSKYFDQNAARTGTRRAQTPPYINTTLSPIKIALSDDGITGPMGSSRPLLEAPKWPLPLGPIQTAQAAEPPKSAEPAKPSEPNITSPAKGHKRTKSSYSLFPTAESLQPPAQPGVEAATQPSTQPTLLSQPQSSQADADATLQLPATVYTPPGKNYAPKPAQPQVTAVDDVEFDLFPLAPPPVAWDQRHRRGASTESSATVQIGLRISTASGARASRNPLSPVRPPLDEEDSSESLGLPRQGPTAWTGLDESQGPLTAMKQSQNKIETAPAAPGTVQSPLQPGADKSLPPTPRVPKSASTTVPQSPPSSSPTLRSESENLPHLSTAGVAYEPDLRPTARSPGPGFF